VRPLYLLLGTETFLRRVAAQEITEAALSRTLLREFNESAFSLLTDAVQ
jgi:DNA polymerase III delta subunit